MEISPSHPLNLGVSILHTSLTPCIPKETPAYSIFPLSSNSPVLTHPMKPLCPFSYHHTLSAMWWPDPNTVSTVILVLHVVGVAQWLALLPHSARPVRLPAWVTVCVESARSPRVCVGFLRVLRYPPMVQKTCWLCVLAMLNSPSVYANRRRSVTTRRFTQ